MRISDWSSDVCSSDLLAFEHDDLAILRNQFLVLATVAVADNQALFALGVLAEADHAGALGQDGRVLGLACLEQVGNARQTAGDIAGLGGFLRDTRNRIAHTHRRTRSEEHTSELQSLMRISYAVFCLKKK